MALELYVTVIGLPPVLEAGALQDAPGEETLSAAKLPFRTGQVFAAAAVPTTITVLTAAIVTTR